MRYAILFSTLVATSAWATPADDHKAALLARARRMTITTTTDEPVGAGFTVWRARHGSMKLMSFALAGCVAASGFTDNQLSVPLVIGAVVTDTAATSLVASQDGFSTGASIVLGLAMTGIDTAVACFVSFPACRRAMLRR